MSSNKFDLDEESIYQYKNMENTSRENTNETSGFDHSSYGSLRCPTEEEIAYQANEPLNKSDSTQTSYSSSTISILVIASISSLLGLLIFSEYPKNSGSVYSQVKEFIRVNEIETSDLVTDKTPNGLVLAPTMYPTEAHPTMFPSYPLPTAFPTTTPGNPTLYPTAQAPTQFPTPLAPTAVVSYTTVTSSPPSVTVSATTESPSPTSVSVAENSLKFTTKRNGYNYLEFFSLTPNSFLTYKIFDGYSGLVEPGVDMYLHIFDVEDSDSADDTYYYKYSICDNASGVCGEYYYSDPFAISCTPLTSNFTVTVQQYESATDAKTAVSSQGSLLCMYVRREFRSLTGSDLNKTMEAMWTMWAVDEDTGIELYGDKYHNYARLLEYHYFNAAWQDSDHIHEGNGFIAQHIKMDLIFQRSMQAVDPTVTLPYWDFTM